MIRKGIDLSDLKESEPELVGASPGVIAILMAIVTLIVPFGFLHGIVFFADATLSSGMYGLLWSFGASEDLGLGYYGFHFFTPSLTVITIVLSIFNLLFAREVVRYYQGKTSKKWAVFMGAMSFIYPALFAFVSLPLPVIAMWGIIWPIPIQFIFGLVLLQRVPGPELISSPIE
ncbi:MAG: hypothetical protein EAX87_08225 [Candidatus Thorarchaeota archaeon]|nr:hypothetical protein [Candidatus Thorarchaeota archaeon]